jgi:uracil-DNA glycosylase family 4
MLELPVSRFIEDNERPWRFGDCDNCPLNPPHVVRSIGVGNGIAIIGESPGAAEVLKGRPFIGPSGQLIRTILQKLGQNPDEVYWTNALLCHADKPSKESIVACNDRLREELSDVGTKKILVLGAVALQAISSPSRAISITNARGKGFWTDLNGRDIYTLATFHPAAVLRDSELFRDLVFDVQKFLTHDAPIEPLSPHTFISWTTTQALRRLPLLLGASRISCDIETTGLSSAVDAVVSIGFGVKRLDGEIEVQIIPAHVFADEEVAALIKKFFVEYKGKLIFHNGKFDMKMLSVLYKKPLHPVNFVDTMILHYLIDERASSEATRGRKPAAVPKRHGLKVLVKLEYDDEYGWDWKKWNELSPKTKEHWEEFFYYQAKDCAYTLALEEKYDAKLSDKQHRLLAELLYPASKALQDIENHGAPLDLDYLTKLEVEKREEIRLLLIRLRKIVRIETGIRDWSTDRQKQIAAKSDEPTITRFNPKSYYHVKKLVYGVWKTPYQVSMTHLAKQRRKEGKDYWSTDDITLTKLAEKETNPIREEILRCIIEYRRLTQVYAKDIVGLISLVELGRIRTNFLLHGTVTGRLSCIAAKTPIEIVRDVSKSPTGTPIEEVKIGDLAYCFDNAGNPRIRRVLNVVNNGYKKVLRIHWRSLNQHRTGYLDLTPNHQVRHSTGEWCAAAEIKVGASLLNLHRSGEKLYTSTKPQPIKDHRLVYAEIFGDDPEHVHHKNENHLDNRPENLLGLSNSEHAVWHSNNPHDELRRKRSEIMRRRHREGTAHGALSGENNMRWRGLTKQEIIEALEANDYRTTLAAKDLFTDYETFVKYIKLTGLNLDGIKKKSKEIRADEIKKLAAKARAVHEENARQKDLAYYAEHNHQVIKIEALPNAVEVYDLEIEYLHNFIAGEICVHNCRNPNLQNIPVRTDKTIPTAFRAPEGWSIIEADYSQLEIRVLAEFCQDENLLRACATEDIHGDIASRVFGKPPGDISDFERKLTKTMVFGTLYGRSAQGILKGEEMGELVKRGMNRWTEDQANAFISRLFSLYPGMNTLFKRLKNDAATKHYVEYSLGRRRRFPFISDTSREEILRQAVNAPIQGTASDICLDGLVRLHSRLQGNYPANILLTVHDSILLEGQNDRLADIVPLVRETMEDVQIFTPKIPFKVKIKVGPTWGEVEEI